MSNKWVPAPRVRPHVCASCKRGGQEHGPYFESAFHYPDPVTGSELRHYTCLDCARHEFLADGSPFAALIVQAQAAQTDAETERDLADAAAQELREALEQAQAGRPLLANGLDHGELAGALAAALEERWGTPPASWRERAQGVR